MLLYCTYIEYLITFCWHSLPVHIVVGQVDDGVGVVRVVGGCGCRKAWGVGIEQGCGHGGPVRVHMHKPGCTHAWGPGVSMRAWARCVHAWRPSMRAWPGVSVQAWPGASVHAWPGDAPQPRQHAIKRV